MIPGEEVALQHQLLVCDMMIDMPPQIKRKFTPRPKVWKLRDPQTCGRFQEVFKAHVPAVETEAATTTEEIWAKLKTGLLKTTEEVCGTTKPHRWRRKTWWWNKEVDDAITAKRQAFKAWKAGKCTRASYNTAKRISRRVVHHARHEADKVVYEGIDQCYPMAVGPSDISGNDWLGPINSSPAADRMSDEIFGANLVFFWPKFALGSIKK